MTVNTGNQVYNDGLMEATANSLAVTVGTLAIKDSVVNAGTVQADGIGAAVTLSSATFDNLFSVVAKNGGTVTFTDVKVTNEAVSTTDPAGGTINATGGTITFDGGSIANGNLLEATNGGTLQLKNITVTNSSAATASVDATSTVDLMAAAILGGTIENAGHVVVTDGASVLHGDSVTNSGTMTIEAGASLTLEGDTTLINETGGIITADGGGATVSIEIDTDTNVNSGTIQAVNGGEIDFYINVDGGSNHGLIEAGAGGTVHFYDTHGGGGGGGGPQGGNYGTMEATDGGVLIFDGGLDNFYLVEAVNGGTVDLNNGIKNHAGRVEAIGSDSVTTVTTTITIDGDVINNATIEATGFGAQINIANSDASENAGTIIAENHGTITLSAVELENDHGATVEANRGTINFFGGTITNDGTFESDHQGAIFVDSHTVYNDGTGVFEALSDGLISFGEGTVYNGVTVSGASGGTIEALHGGSVEFATTTVYNGSSVAGTAGGTILASCGGTVSLSLSCTIYNNNDAGGPGGVIEALRGGTVHIDTSTVFNNGGLIEAIGCGAVVDLFGTDIYGGTLASSDGGVIEATFGRSTLQDVTILGGSVLDAADTGLGGYLRAFGNHDAGRRRHRDVRRRRRVPPGRRYRGVDGRHNAEERQHRRWRRPDRRRRWQTDARQSGGRNHRRERARLCTHHPHRQHRHQCRHSGSDHRRSGGSDRQRNAQDRRRRRQFRHDHELRRGVGRPDRRRRHQREHRPDRRRQQRHPHLRRRHRHQRRGRRHRRAKCRADHLRSQPHRKPRPYRPNGGTVILDHNVVENDSAPSESGNGGITANGGGTITFEYGCVTNNGAIEARMALRSFRTRPCRQDGRHQSGRQRDRRLRWRLHDFHG